MRCRSLARGLAATVAVAAAAAAGWTACRGVPPVTPPSTASVSRHTGPTIEQVRELAELVTLRVDVADVQETTVAGALGGLRVVLVVNGDFALAVDLDRARFTSVDPAARTAVLLLPAPQPTGARVDHDRTRVVHVSDDGLWAVVPGDAGARGRAVDRAYAEAQRAVAAAAADPALAGRARRRAKAALAAFFRATGWTVEVRWEP